MEVRFIWFDSLGAKSSCTLVRTKDASILIDPGIAVMHPSFPAPREAKLKWFQEGFEAIKRAAKLADIVVITHYHYDHFVDFDEGIYLGKDIFIKDPNRYINDSQRGRSLSFFSNLYGSLGLKLEELMEPPEGGDYRDPLEELPIASRKDFGEYNTRRGELLTAGLRWFNLRVNKWNSYRRIPELEGKGLRVRFADGKSFKIGGTKIKFTKPFFHGVEFSRLGWVIGVVIEEGSEKFLYSSDLNGPVIEDYANWIVSESADVMVVDGPPTYLLGYTMNLINFRRALANAMEIVKNSKAKLIIYDHHLPREPKFKERTKEVWELAKNYGKKLSTVAEYFNLKPAVLKYLK